MRALPAFGPFVHEALPYNSVTTWGYKEAPALRAQRGGLKKRLVGEGAHGHAVRAAKGLTATGHGHGHDRLTDVAAYHVSTTRRKRIQAKQPVQAAM